MAENVNLESSEKEVKRPLSWQQFKKLTAEEQADYLTALQEQFGATASLIAKGFSIGQATFYKYLQTEKIPVQFPRAKRMDPEQVEAFEKFTGIKSKPKGGRSSAKITNVTLTLEGKFSKEMFYSALAETIPEGTKVIIKIDCQIQ